MKAIACELDAAIIDAAIGLTEDIGDEAAELELPSAGVGRETDRVVPGDILDCIEADLLAREEESGHYVPTSPTDVEELASYDEYGLSCDDRSVVNAVAERLAKRTKHMTKAYMVSGPDLVLARNKLAKSRSGAWSDWIENETDLDYKQVLRIINAYERTQPVVDEHFGGLLGKEWQRISLTAFYRFAKLKPVQIKQLIELAKAGQKVRPKTINELFDLNEPTPKLEERALPEEEAYGRPGERDTPPEFDNTTDPVVGLVSYFRSQGFDCLVRASDNPFEGPFAVLFYRGGETPVSDWNDCGKARPADDIESLLIGQGE